MKKSTKIIRLSVTLLLLIAMLLTPMSPVFAVVIENGDADLTAADIVSEDASKREKFSRHYLTGDGTYFAVSYAEQVNYQDEDGNWIAVDNSLSTNVLTGEKTTKNDKFKVKFANKANKDDLVSIQTNDYKVSFGITVSEDGESYLELNKVKGTENPGNTSAEPKTTQEATSLGKAVSGITYFDAFSDYLDVRYSVAHEKVKEDLILERKSGFNSYKVTYNIKEKDALATLNDDGSITFTNPDGAVLFNVGVPVMYDSDGKSSADIAVSMAQGKKTVEVTYTPSAEWLDAEERVYPVTIDPSVSSSQVTSNIIDTSYSVDSNTEEMSISETLYMGQGYSAFIKINQVADVPIGGTLLGADLVLYGDYGYTNNANNVFRFTIFELTETWNEYALSGDNLPERNISNARVYDNPSHQTSIGDDFIQFTFNLSNDLWESDGFNDYFENYNGFEIYLDHNSYFEAHSGEYPTVELRPCIRTRYSAPSINSVNARSAYSLTSENTYGTAAEINTGKEYRLLNTSSQDYITYSSSNIVLSDYIQGSISQKISFYYDSSLESYSIMLTNGNEYLYYYVDSDGALTYTVWTTSSVVNDYDRWKIYDVNGSLVIASAADEQYVLTDVNGILNVKLYDSTDNSQKWSTETFNSILLNQLYTSITLGVGESILIKTPQNVLSYEIRNATSSGVISINSGVITAWKNGYADINIATSNGTIYTINVYVSIADGDYYIGNASGLAYSSILTNNGAASTLSHFTESNNQLWEITYVGNGYHNILNYGTTAYLTSSSSYSCYNSSYTGSDTQLWKITWNYINGTYTLQSKAQESDNYMLGESSFGALTSTTVTSAWNLFTIGKASKIAVEGQIDENSCWVAAARMFAKHYSSNIQATQQQAIQYVKGDAPNNGGTMDEVCQAIDFFDNTLDVVKYENMILTEPGIITALNFDDIVLTKLGQIIVGTNSVVDDGHAAIISGYLYTCNQFYYILKDPIPVNSGCTYLFTYNDLTNGLTNDGITIRWIGMIYSIDSVITNNYHIDSNV